ncbi:hypothetical protein ACA910_017002 [Epithemia clementina (nom. ined.)]
MSSIMVQKRVLRGAQDVEPVQKFLLDSGQAIRISEILGAEQDSTTDEQNHAVAEFRSRMNDRLLAFLKELNFTKEQKNYMDRCLTYIGDRCASMQTGAPLVVAWLKWRHTGSIPRENCVSTYMYALGLMRQSDDKIIKECMWDVVSLHGLLFPANEKTATLRIQSLIAQGQPLAAEKLVFSLPVASESSTDTSKLRTFAPILSYYCHQSRDMASALRLFVKMRASRGVHLDAATYAMLLSSLASNGYFKAGTEVETEMGLFDGAKLFDEISTQMASDLLELTEDAANALYQGFAAAACSGGKLKSKIVDESIPDYSSIGGFHFGRAEVNETTGVCTATGVKLRSLTLDDQQRMHVRETLLNMAYSLQEDYISMVKQKKNSVDLPTGDFCKNQLQNFSNWLSVREQQVSVFVDGANVAHFGSGMVQYSQVKLMVDELVRLGENPMVIMPYKYTIKKFYLRHLGVVQELKKKDIQAIDELKERGMLFVVPQYCFDDYYWMIASVTDQNQDHNNPTKQDNNAGVSLTGRRPILVTNDQMRDHRLALLEPRPFRRWTSCHIVNFAIDGYLEDEWETGRGIRLFPPTVFSREIQSNALPTGRKVWHFPVTGWDEPLRLCISIAPGD